MSKRPFFKRLHCFGLLFCLIPLTLEAASSGGNRLIGTNGPITITSSRLTADNKAHTALFEGSVIAKSGTMTIYSDTMLVYYSDDGRVTKIESNGHVKVIRGERVITSDAATYFADEEKVIFSGQPKAVEGSNVVTGTKMIYLMKEDRSLVEDSKVFLEKGSTVKR